MGKSNAETLSKLNPCITKDMQLFLERILPGIAEGYGILELNESLSIHRGQLKVPMENGHDREKIMERLTQVASGDSKYVKDLKITERTDKNYDIEFRLEDEDGIGKDVYIRNIAPMIPVHH